ncbi:hypothetical protein J1N35_018810 [Gossypium stocksii]|uniref:Uncharacterized protein n=1 Tax=Gossypium stocksii TaxID=47602 RepID=A0A9D4A709_9ROSI|nr:hypothetical protein J1N35_018810 [Gossypium stocksii]
MVHGLRFGDLWCNDTKLLKAKMFNLFSNYFSCSSRKWIIDMDLNFKKISEEDVVKLELSFTLEEIKEARKLLLAYLVVVKRKLYVTRYLASKNQGVFGNSLQSYRRSISDTKRPNLIFHGLAIHFNVPLRQTLEMSVLFDCLVFLES